MHYALSHFCAELGKDPLLVQGAGGNVSWKEGSTLWVKGSGTWLANGDTEDIFVPVDLTEIHVSLQEQNSDITPRVIGEHRLKPSIETVLHAIMPQRVVVHLHAIHVLRILVRADSKKAINLLFNEPVLSGISFAYISYHKPGIELANAVLKSIQGKSDIDIVFLENHGIVLGADTIDGIKNLLNRLDNACICLAPQLCLVDPPDETPLSTVPPALNQALTVFPDPEVQTLVNDPNLFKRLKVDWVLFPDHAVFLGPEAMVFTSWTQLASWQSQYGLPELVFIENTGVYMRADLNRTKQLQLRCYYDVISRVSPDTILRTLSATDVDALLNWDAEKLRQRMAAVK